MNLLEREVVGQIEPVQEMVVKKDGVEVLALVLEEPRKTRPAIVEVQGVKSKVCSCGECFPLEYHPRGGETTRKLCDDCRIENAKRENAELPGTEGVLRCGDCTGLLGPEWGTITHLDQAGLCPDCASWSSKRVVWKERDRMGLEIRGGLLLKKINPFA